MPCAMSKYRLSLSLILTLVHNTLTHPVDILLARMFSLTYVNVAHDFLPTSVHVEPFGLLTIRLLLTHVILSPLLLLLVLSLLPLLQLLTGLLFASLLQLVLFILNLRRGTLFSLSTC